jgi:hypothetical protein
MVTVGQSEESKNARKQDGGTGSIASTDGANRAASRLSETVTAAMNGAVAYHPRRPPLPAAWRLAL